jgi:hypothetical protein
MITVKTLDRVKVIFKPRQGFEFERRWFDKVFAPKSKIKEVV